MVFLIYSHVCTCMYTHTHTWLNKKRARKKQIQMIWLNAQQWYANENEYTVVCQLLLRVLISKYLSRLSPTTTNTADTTTTSTADTTTSTKNLTTTTYIRFYFITVLFSVQLSCSLCWHIRIYICFCCCCCCYCYCGSSHFCFFYCTNTHTQLSEQECAWRA